MQKEKDRLLPDVIQHRHSAFGKEAEEATSCYLKKRKYRILKRNYACRFGEIDIIAQSDRAICFIEVKARTHVDFGPPSIFVTPQKQAKIKKTALFFINAKKLNNLNFRFDVASVVKDEKGSFKIELIEGAFE